MGLHHALLVVSGICGLGYQIVWTRWFGFGLGHEMAGVMGVVGAFFLGLALGGWALDRPVAKAARPGLWYVALEVVLAAWALASLALIPNVDEIAASLLGRSPSAAAHAGLATLIPALLLLPATVAMGATLPAMERFAAARERARGGPSQLVGGLYSANTAGAMLGTLAITFWVLPSLGFQGTTLLLALLNLLCAVGALALGATRPTEIGLSPAAAEAPPKAQGPQPPEPAPELPGDAISDRRVLGTLFATGFLGIAYETVGIRMLTQVLENTVYTFAVVLSIYLAGTAIGAAAYQRWLRKTPLESLLGPLVSALAVACLVGAGSMDFARDLHGSLGNEQGFLRAILVEGLLAGLVFLIPTILMGALFGALAQRLRRPEGGLGRALAVNTLGSALAPSLSGWVLVPAIGLRWGIVSLALGYGALAIGRARSTAYLLAGLLALAWIGTSDLGLVDMDEGTKVLHRRDGVMASVTVTERSAGSARTLRVDNHFRMGGSQTVFLERRLGMIPLLLHEEPKSALFLGLGTGVTLSSATFFEDLQADGVELVPEVLDALPFFKSVNRTVAEHPSIDLYAADARRFVRASEPIYDVIIADLFQPARDGAGSLYTVEHFEAVGGALREGGLFCQWVPLYQMDGPIFRTIVHSFLEAFPHADAYLAVFNAETPAIGLVGSAAPIAIQPDALRATMDRASLQEQLQSLALDDIYDLLGSRVANREQLEALGKEQPLNTDDRPIVMFESPAFVYDSRVDGWTNLMPLLGLDPAPARDLLAGSSEDSLADLAQRVEGYVGARNAFMQGQVALSEGRDSDALQHYVSSVAASTDFNAGYSQVIALANSPGALTRAELRAAVDSLARLRPELGDLKQLKRQLAPR